MQSKATWLICFKGLPGVGKSTLSRMISSQRDWTLIERDLIKDRIERFPNSGAIAYEIMFSLARLQLEHGRSVVLDSTLTLPVGYNAAKVIAGEAGSKFAVIECFCPDEGVWRHRLEERTKSVPAGHRQISWAELKAHRLEVRGVSDYPIDVPHLKVDSSRALLSGAESILDWLTRIGA